MEIRSLEVSHNQFMEKMKAEDPDFFKKLGEGQQPSFFVLSCCDSRTCPSTITGMPLGEMFTHRNIANQVTEEDDSFRASLHYALDVLGVNYVIILGHTNCGGILAASSGVQHESLDGWLKHVKATLDEYDKSKQAPTPAELEEHNVRQQIINVKNHPVYQRKGEGVPVIGLLFHLDSGELQWIDPDDNN
ncbi:carbonate dehydratase [Salipaludibacillus sp. CUR1]|uniref:carbonic anhydrase n=1 Tax=Salipaludibacillus sp. CUR1 TaxID=2820003 RepID=UPI001E43BE3E|nr:carbonic anhydrase [Salipaludibacillus sp. CUR1]MCE7791646.1 carbonate dehydratase [Salipaludibacillus sp. CUR1]